MFYISRVIKLRNPGVNTILEMNCKKAANAFYGSLALKQEGLEFACVLVPFGFFYVTAFILFCFGGTSPKTV